uniref:Uncharacterized protein n=2 Tax=Tetranychus urticae TaxID=32264 RepID=T1KPS9_TETUR
MAASLVLLMYQEELPKILAARKERQIRHDELVQITKWKLWRTKNRAGLLDLVRMNTETAVKAVSTKAFKKCPTNLHGAISALVNLKGIGVATASAILCAYAPEICPFMADECLMSVPGIENTNYTVNEFIAFADQIKVACDRLQAEDPTAKWTPHKVELTLWTHYWIKEMKLNLLDNMPTPDGVANENDNEKDDDDLKNGNGDSHTNGGGDKVLDDDSNISVPVSNASEVEEKSNDSTKDDLDGDSRLGRNDKNNGSAYNCIEDSKDGLGLCSDDNSRQQIITNGDNSNLSYSNLSSDDLNNSTAENTADAPTNSTILTPTATPTPPTTTTTITTNNNGHVANGESCNDDHNVADNGDTKISEIKKSENNSLEENVITDMDTLSKTTTNATAIKRPVEEITNEIKGSEDNGSLEKKSRIE